MVGRSPVLRCCVDHPSSVEGVQDASVKGDIIVYWRLAGKELTRRRNMHVMQLRQ